MGKIDNLALKYGSRKSTTESIKKIEEVKASVELDGILNTDESNKLFDDLISKLSETMG